jgi:putative component of membrane protein insertase Oxa1/YidC/SpoIIIJ protein YidD
MNTDLRLSSIHLLKAHLQAILNYAEYHSNAFCTADVLEIILNHTTISTTLTTYQKTYVDTVLYLNTCVIHYFCHHYLHESIYDSNFVVTSKSKAKLRSLQYLKLRKYVIYFGSRHMLTLCHRSLYICNKQHDAQIAEPYTFISALMQPTCKFQSSADHYGHLIPVPKIKFTTFSHFSLEQLRL